MVTALQIALLLILIALIGILLGYLFGRIACKKREQSLFFDKSEYCEDIYNQSLSSNESIESTNTQYNSSVSNVMQSSFDAPEEKDIVAEDSKVAQGVMDSSLKDSVSSESTNDPKEEDNESIEEKEKAQESEEENSAKPPVLDEPKNGVKDNLCRIKGIGTVIEGKLNNLGVFHFEQIAAWSEDEIKWIDSHLAFSGRIVREDWIGQAKLLAAGEETEFSKRVDKGEVATSKKD